MHVKNGSDEIDGAFGFGFGLGVDALLLGFLALLSLDNMLGMIKLKFYLTNIK